MRLFFAVLLITIFTSPSFAERNISKDAFFTDMESKIPAKLCGLSAIKACFKHVSRFQCTLFMARAMKGCSVGWRKQYPALITQAEAVEIGDILVTCATKKFQKTYLKDPQKTVLCLKIHGKKK